MSAFSAVVTMAIVWTVWLRQHERKPGGG
jgi:hypothetical protein